MASTHVAWLFVAMATLLAGCESLIGLDKFSEGTSTGNTGGSGPSSGGSAGVDNCVATEEICDGLDNDCNDDIDEGLVPPPCAKTEGVCALAGADRVCQGTKGWTACDYGPNYEETETLCDGLDNDCNGIVDDVAGCLYTLAGSGPPGYRDASGTEARFADPGYLSADNSGNVYIADRSNHVIRVAAPDGKVTTFAGSGRCGFKDGTALEAEFCEPMDAVFHQGTVYVSDSGNHRLRKVEAGFVTTLAGTGEEGSTDGAALTEASFGRTWGIFVVSSGTSTNGDVLIADTTNQKIRRYHASSKTVDTVVGTGVRGLTDGRPWEAELMDPSAILETSDRTMYVSEFGADRIRKVPSFGDTTTFVGSTTGKLPKYSSNDPAEGLPGVAVIRGPKQLRLDASANVLYVLDSEQFRIRAVPLSGTSSTYSVAGSRHFWQGFKNGPPLVHVEDGNGFMHLTGFTVSGSNWIIADGNHVLRKVEQRDFDLTVVEDFVGGSVSSKSFDASAAFARLRAPRGLARTSDGTLYWVEDDVCTLRMLTTDGAVTTLVKGCPSTTSGADGTFVTGSLRYPRNLHLGPDGLLYILEWASGSIRRADATNSTLSTYIRQKTSQSADDGRIDQAGAGTVAEARYLCFGTTANGKPAVYVSDHGIATLRRVVDNQITNLAGTKNLRWSADPVDGALGAGRFRSLGACAADDQGNVYVYDLGYVRHVSPAGVLTTLNPSSRLSLFEDVGLVLEGGALVIAVGTELIRFDLEGNTASVLASYRRGWNDGTVSDAGAMSFTAIWATPEAYYLSDEAAGRLRRLWR